MVRGRTKNEVLRKQRTEDIMTYLAARKSQFVYIKKLSQDLNLPYSSTHQLLHELAEQKKVELQAHAGGNVVQVVG